jgi:hypothetical protein
MKSLNVLWICWVCAAPAFANAESSVKSGENGWLIPLDRAGEPVTSSGFGQYRTKAVRGYLLHIEVLHATHVRNYLLDLTTGASTSLGDGEMSFSKTEDRIVVVGRSEYLDSGGRFWYDLIIDFQGTPLQVISGKSSSCLPVEESPNPLRQLIEEAGYSCLPVIR